MINNRLVNRQSWIDGFPDVWIHADEMSVKKDFYYLAAKSGDSTSVAKLIQTHLNFSIIQNIADHYDGIAPILVSVHAEEEWGRNAIPEMMAERMSEVLGWGLDASIVQANVVNHTGADGFSRMARQAVFYGDVVANADYFIVDDFIGQGGTIANLRGFIEHHGARVIGASALTGKAFSAKLALEPSLLQTLRDKHGHIENWWIEQFGFGFEALTQSEARYLERTADADTIRDRILAAA